MPDSNIPSTTTADWDAGLFRLLEANDELGHPSWCDLSLCTVERERGELTGFHESRRLATVETDVDSWAAGDFYFSLEQWCADAAPGVRLIVNAEGGHATVSLPPGQIAPLIAAITTAGEAVMAK